MRLFSDRVRLRVVSADIWSRVRQLNQDSIPVFELFQEDDLTYSFWINRRNYAAVRACLEKRGDRVSLLRGSLLRSLEQSLLNRPVLYSGLVLFFALSLLLPTRILAIEVEGNTTVPARRILEAAAGAGIRFFSPCAEVRSERMKNALLAAVPELQWAGINTYGSRAVISVRERSASNQEPKQEPGISSIVAQRDGVIQSVTALRGSIQCREGQAVKTGQVLISGYTDCGICIRGERASGEVYAQTGRALRTVTPSTALFRGEPEGEQRRWWLTIGKNRINLWKDSGIWDSTCGRISREYGLRLPGGFLLPVSVTCETLVRYTIQEEPIPEETAREGLSSFSQHYLSSQMIAGVITHAEETMEQLPGCYLLSGHYLCSEMIGRERLENGAQHEQNH